jgi:surfeit locus 1 family protein
MSRLSRIVLAIAVVLATTVLLGLGAWQVQRLQWKEALIADVNARVAAPARPLAEIEAEYATTGDVDYFPVRLAGRFDNSREMYFYTTHNGRAGWNVYVPLAMASGRTALVNRGFVAAELKEPEKRREGLVAGEVEITGLARNVVLAKPNSMMPDNEPANRLFFWKSMPEMALAAGIEPDALLPFFIDAGPAPNPGGWPQGGTTIIAFSNNHLQYAITWFGLAMACLGVGGYLLFSGGGRRRG